MAGVGVRLGARIGICIEEQKTEEIERVDNGVGRLESELDDGECEESMQDLLEYEDIENRSAYKDRVSLRRHKIDVILTANKQCLDAKLELDGQLRST